MEKEKRLDIKQWKRFGSKHYKNNSIEPIDLIIEGGMAWDFAVANIIKYAYRNRRMSGVINVDDVNKIIHYAELLKIIAND